MQMFRFIIEVYSVYDILYCKVDTCNLLYIKTSNLLLSVPVKHEHWISIVFKTVDNYSYSMQYTFQYTML